MPGGEVSCNHDDQAEAVEGFGQGGGFAMSIRLMSAIFESQSLGPTERLIMLALADHADDEGRCYPSIARLSQRTGLSERAVQTNLRKLVEQGYVRIVPGGGKGNSNLYFVSANPAAGAPFDGSNPAADAPRTKCTPAADAPQTPQELRANPAAAAPEPSGTIKEPSEEPIGSLSSQVDDMPKSQPELSQAVEAYNLAASESGWPKVQVLSRARRSALAARLRECGGIAGWAAALAKAQASEHCCGQNDRGWTANFDFLTRQSSFAKLMEGNYDNRPRSHRQPADRRQDRPDPALEQISRLAGLGQAQGHGRG